MQQVLGINSKSVSYLQILQRYQWLFFTLIRYGERLRQFLNNFNLGLFRRDVFLCRAYVCLTQWILSLSFALRNK